MDNFMVTYNDVKEESLFCKICRVTACVLVALRFAMIICNIFSYSIFINGVSQFTIAFVIDLLLVSTAVGSINFKNRIFYVFTGVVAAVLILIYGSSLLSYTRDIKYTSYSSPDATNTIVLKEDAYMFSGNTRFYKKINSFLIKDTGEHISMDDGYQSISNGKIVVSWVDEDNVELDYYDKTTDELLLQKKIALD